MTINTSYLASEAVATILHEFTDGFTISNTGRGLVYQAWLPEDNRLESRVEDLRQRFANLPAELLEDGEPTVERGWINEEDWAEAWKAYWQPTRVGQRLVIKPSWRDWPPADQPELAGPDDLVIELDPGMAFGTGAHATTTLCLEALERVIHGGERLVDLGCGTGILSIGALMLGAAEATAIDNDPLATEATKENCRRNGVTGCRVLLQDTLQGVEPGQDLVVANISLPIVMSVAPAAKELLKPGGLFICSGFYGARREELAEALQKAGLTVEQFEERESWGCMIARR